MIKRSKKYVCLTIIMSLFINQSTITFADNLSPANTNSTQLSYDSNVTDNVNEDISLSQSYVIKGSWVQKNNLWMYVYANNQKAIGWKFIQDNWYYFDSQGIMKTDWQFIDNKWYYLDLNGIMVTGWTTLNNVVYYLKSDGSMATEWQFINGQWYYFDLSGSKKSGWITLNNKSYFLKSDGSMATEWQFINGQWYYFDLSGSKKSGWITLNNKSYFLKSDGSMATGFYSIENKKYYFDTDGSRLTGWQQINKNWYYFDNTNGNMKTGWLFTGSKWYYLNENGIMSTGWLYNNNCWYYLDQDGAMLTQWQFINGNWYYLNSDGSMSDNWKQIDGKWYYFKPTSGYMITGWLQLGNTWYYLSPDGSMATGTHLIDNVRYNFNSSGEWIPNNTSTNNKLIIVDPGHNHGGDYGSESFHDGIKYSETDLDMEIALKVKSNLEQKGYEVKLTREETDKFYDNLSVSLMKRSSLANNSNADLFISLHHDSSSSPSTKGISTHYSTYKPNIDNEGIIIGNDPNGWYSGVKIDSTPCDAAIKSKLLSDRIASDLSFQMGYANRLSHDHNLSVTVKTNMASLLIECGFLSNKEEAIRAANFNNQSKMGQVIADAVETIIK